MRKKINIVKKDLILYIYNHASSSTSKQVIEEGKFLKNLTFKMLLDDKNNNFLNLLKLKKEAYGNSKVLKLYKFLDKHKVVIDTDIELLYKYFYFVNLHKTEYFSYIFNKAKSNPRVKIEIEQNLSFKNLTFQMLFDEHSKNGEFLNLLDYGKEAYGDSEVVELYEFLEKYKVITEKNKYLIYKCFYFVNLNKIGYFLDVFYEAKKYQELKEEIEQNSSFKNLTFQMLFDKHSKNREFLNLLDYGKEAYGDSEVLELYDWLEKGKSLEDFFTEEKAIEHKIILRRENIEILTNLKELFDKQLKKANEISETQYQEYEENRHKSDADIQQESYEEHLANMTEEEKHLHSCPWATLDTFELQAKDFYKDS